MFTLSLKETEKNKLVNKGVKLKLKFSLHSHRYPFKISKLFIVKLLMMKCSLLLDNLLKYLTQLTIIKIRKNILFYVNHVNEFKIF